MSRDMQHGIVMIPEEFSYLALSAFFELGFATLAGLKWRIQSSAKLRSQQSFKTDELFLIFFRVETFSREVRLSTETFKI